MRTIRLRRAAVLFIAGLGLLGTAAPADAHGVSAAVAVFQGQATLSAGLSYPCVGTLTLDLNKCPSVALNTGKTVPVVVTGGNTRTVNSFTSTICVGAGVLNTTPAVGACAIVNVGTGVVTGSCGLSSGLVTASVSGGGELETADVHWVAVGGTLILTGSVQGHATSAVVGVVQATPPPSTTLPGTSTGNSCLSKTATEFLLVGVTALVAV